MTQAEADLMRSRGLRSWGSKRGNNERGGNGQNAPLAARLGIPQLDDDGRSHPCVAAGFIGLAFHRNKNGPVNESSRARESTPTERLRAMREYASAAGGLKAKG